MEAGWAGRCRIRSDGSPASLEGSRPEPEDGHERLRGGGCPGAIADTVHRDDGAGPARMALAPDTSAQGRLSENGREEPCRHQNGDREADCPKVLTGTSSTKLGSVNQPVAASRSVHLKEIRGILSTSDRLRPSTW